MKILIEQDPNSHYLRINGNKNLDFLVDIGKAQLAETTVKDPLLRDVNAQYYILDNKTAIIKIANASGLSLLKESEKNPMYTSSYGTGELILHALNKGCREFVLGLGHSSTIDCGIGLLDALGVKYFNKDDLPVKLYGKEIKNIARYDISNLDSRIKESKFTLITEMESEFSGMGGAAYKDGPHIGATKLMVQALDRGLNNFAYVVRKQTGIDLDNIHCAGVAGGIAGSLSVFLNSKIANSLELEL